MTYFPMIALTASPSIKKTIALGVILGIFLSSPFVGLWFQVAAQTSPKHKPAKKKTKSHITNPAIIPEKDVNESAATASPEPTPTKVLAEQFEIIPSAQVSRASDVTLTIKSKECPADNTFLSADKVVAASVKENIKDYVTFPEKPVIESEGCVLKLSLSVSRSAPSNNVDITLGLDGNKETVITLLITQEEPLPPKPIPPGLKPQVDVMWRVVPQQIVKDNFGTRVGKLFYCLEVIIGNNSGYDLQIAAVGFQVGPLGDATKSMAELLKKSYQEADDSNKVLLDAAQANARAATTLAIAAREEGLRDLRAEWLASKSSKLPTPSPAEMEAACKQDAECVSMNKKAADARSRAVIASREADLNNQAADAVSKAQRFSAQTLIARRDELAAKSRAIYPSSIPSSSYRMTRGSLEHGQFWSVRNLTINSLRAFGPFLTGFTPYFRNINHQKNYAEGINIISNPLEKGFELVVPDETVSQLQRLDEQILRDGLIIQNNRQVVTHTFMPKDNLGLEKKMRDDPLMVTLALGKMTIIGDQIEFRNRVSVTSGPSGEVQPPPTVNPKSIETFLQDEERAVSFTGANLENADVYSDSVDTIHVEKTSNAAGSITVKVRPSGESVPGTHSLFAKTQSGSPITIPIIVERPQPQTDAQGDKKISASSKSDPIKASLTEDLVYEIVINGKYLHGAALTPVELIGKKLIALTPPAVNAEGTSFTVNIQVPKGTPGGVYEFEVRNDRPINKDKPAKIQIQVAKQAGPTIDSGFQTIAKDNSGKDLVANPSKTQDIAITIKGDNLNGGKVTIPTGSNAVGKLEVLSPDEVNSKAKELTKTIRISPAATPTNAPSVDYDLSVETSSGSPPFKIQVKAQPPATVTSPALDQPLSGKPSQAILITLIGTHLEGGSIVLPTGWVVKTAPAVNPEGTQLVEELTIPSDALPANTPEKVFTLDVTNSNTAATPAKFKVKVTP
jgi:hypothetical protein